MITSEHLEFFGEEAEVNRDYIGRHEWEVNIESFMVFFPSIREIWCHTTKSSPISESGSLWFALRRLEGVWKKEAWVVS